MLIYMCRMCTSLRVLCCKEQSSEEACLQRHGTAEKREILRFAQNDNGRGKLGILSTAEGGCATQAAATSLAIRIDTWEWGKERILRFAQNDNGRALDYVSVSASLKN